MIFTYIVKNPLINKVTDKITLYNSILNSESFLCSPINIVSLIYCYIAVTLINKKYEKFIIINFTSCFRGYHF